MAREYAKVLVRLWADDVWRSLSFGAQSLYMAVLTHPSMSYAGVIDWRPPRLRKIAADWDAQSFAVAADELERNLFIVVDEDTEEALVRSFVRNDGLLKVPNMAVAMVKAYGEVSSTDIRGVLVHELHRLHGESPDWAGWAKALPLLNNPSVNPSERASVKGSVNPSVKGSPDPSVNPEPTLSVTPAPSPTKQSPSPSPKERGTQKRAHRLPDDWQPDTDLVAEARSKFPGVNLELETEKFCDHFQSIGGERARKVDWRKAWRNWIRKSYEFAPRTGGNGSRPNTHEAWSTSINEPLASELPSWQDDAIDGEVIEFRRGIS